MNSARTDPVSPHLVHSKLALRKHFLVKTDRAMSTGRILGLGH